MARRTKYSIYIFCFLCIGLLSFIPSTRSAQFSEKTEIRHFQVVYYLVALQKNENFSLNCSTFYNSTVHAFLLNQRPTGDLVNPDGTYKPEMWSIVNRSDMGGKSNATLKITVNETKIFYIQLVQQADKTDFLTVNASVDPDREDFALTRYYIPFVAGYPIVELLFTITAGLFIVQRLYKRRYKLEK